LALWLTAKDYYPWFWFSSLYNVMSACLDVCSYCGLQNGNLIETGHKCSVINHRLRRGGAEAKRLHVPGWNGDGPIKEGSTSRWRSSEVEY